MNIKQFISIRVRVSITPLLIHLLSLRKFLSPLCFISNHIFSLMKISVLKLNSVILKGLILCTSLHVIAGWELALLLFLFLNFPFLPFFGSWWVPRPPPLPSLFFPPLPSLVYFCQGLSSQWLDAARNDWPGLCLFCCYQPSCVVSQHSCVWAVFDHKFSIHLLPSQVFGAIGVLLVFNTCLLLVIIAMIDIKLLPDNNMYNYIVGGDRYSIGGGG